MFTHLTLLMAQQQDGSSSMVGNLVLFGSIIAIFYFMIIRPQQKRAKEREQMMSSIEKGDKIITAGGIHATVVGLDDKSVLVQIADNVKVKLERSSVASVLKDTPPATK